LSDVNEATPGAGPQPQPPAGEPAAPQLSRPASETAPHPRPALPPVHIGGNVGGDVAGGDLNQELNAGRDIIGRDVVTNANTTNVGFTAAAVQRLVLAVGALVAATAACFFVLGSVTAVGIGLAFERKVPNNNLAAAASFADNLAALRALPPGQPYEFTFSEEDINSYFFMTVEPTLNGEVRDSQVRLLDAKRLALSGRAQRLGGLRFAATFAWQTNRPGAPLALTSALVQLLPLGNSPLGWVPLPTLALQPLATRLNALFGNVGIVDVKSAPQAHAWDVTVVGH
jgi:hypothetical protein